MNQTYEHSDCRAYYKMRINALHRYNETEGFAF